LPEYKRGRFRDKMTEAPPQIRRAREVVPKAGARLSAAAILDHLRPRVASWWLPDAVELVDKFPMTATGKVHKLTLRQQYKDYDLQAKAHMPASHRG